MVIKTPLSSRDPITEQEDGCSLDEENERFSSLPIFGKIFLLKVIVMSFESCKIMQIMHKSINIVTGSENHEKLCVRHVGVHLNSYKIMQKHENGYAKSCKSCTRVSPL